MEEDRDSSEVLQTNGLILDQGKQKVSVRGKAHHLTPKECHLLATFMRYPGEVLSRRFLMRKVWNTDWAGDCATLEVHISWLRKKLEYEQGDPQVILTVRGVGYMFTDGQHEAVP